MNDRYISPLSTRYAGKEMQYLFSPDMKFTTFHRLWVALARAEQKLGIAISDEQIAEMDTWKDAKLNEAKSILAYELTKLVHGEEEAEKARKAAQALFGAGGAADMPVTELTESDLTDGAADIKLLLVKAGLVKSNSEARQNITQGGVSLNGEKVTDVFLAVSADTLREGVLLKRGKKSFAKVILK